MCPFLPKSSRWHFDDSSISILIRPRVANPALDKREGESSISRVLNCANSDWRTKSEAAPAPRQFTAKLCLIYG